MAKRNKAREYTSSTVKRLHALSGNQCAAPDCTRALIARDGETIVSKICHIEGASEGGARYNDRSDDDERRHFDNLILLCDECHCIVDNLDNVAKFPVSLLRQWKKDHETNFTYSILSSKPLMLNCVIDAIASMELDATDCQVTVNEKAFDIGDKIRHNNVKRNSALLDEYKVFYSKVNSLYQTLEEEGSFKKQNLLRNIRTIYLRVLGRYLEQDKEPIDVVRSHADSIIDDVYEELLSSIDNNGPTQFEEDISFGVSIVMVDAFMRCKILEEPPVG